MTCLEQMKPVVNQNQNTNQTPWPSPLPPLVPELPLGTCHLLACRQLPLSTILDAILTRQHPPKYPRTHPHLSFKLARKMALIRIARIEGNLS